MIYIITVKLGYFFDGSGFLKPTEATSLKILSSLGVLTHDPLK
jgi:hypothetical protein